MSALTPALQAFFLTGLDRHRGASPHTVNSYRHTFRLLLAFAHQQTGKHPCDLDISDLDSELISRFLDHLETDRNNSVASRNTRLAAIHSFFRFASYRHPEHATTIGQVLAIPVKKTATIPRSFLTQDEMDALIAAPDRSSWLGRRDHTFLVVALRSGLRLSGSPACAARTWSGPACHLKCLGKGRKRRDTPLDKPTATVLRAWLSERRGEPDDVVFPSSRGGRLSPDAVQRLVETRRNRRSPSKDPRQQANHASRHPPQLRHGHAAPRHRRRSPGAVARSRETGIRRRLHPRRPTLKQRALDRRVPPKTRPGRYKPPDKLLAFLESL